MLATRSTFYRNTERVMGWDIVESGFKIVSLPRSRRWLKRIFFRTSKGFLADNNLDPR